MEKVVKGDIFSYVGEGFIVVPTNIEGCHGAGIAKTAYDKGFINYYDGWFGLVRNSKVIKFPVKYKPTDKCDIDLMWHSAVKLAAIAQAFPDKKIYLPLVGIGHGEGDVSTIIDNIISPLLKENDNIILVLPDEEAFKASPKARSRIDRTLEKIPEIIKKLKKNLIMEA